MSSSLAGVAVLAPTTATLVSESCQPANQVIDPGETVTVAFGVNNTGGANTVNDIGTLQNTGGVTAAGAPQNYGVIVASGPSVSRNFTFTAAPTLACGANITATVQHQDGTSNLGNVVYTFTTGVLMTNTTFSENFDLVTPPALPAGWTTDVTGIGVPWTTSTTNPSSAPTDLAFALNQVRMLAAPVPEPASLALFSAGLGFVSLIAIRRRKAASESEFRPKGA